MYTTLTAPAMRASTLDEVFSVIGECGKYQKRVILVVSFVMFSTAFNNLGYVFWAARPDFHCVPDNRVKTLVSSAADGGDSNFTIQDELLMNLTVPWESTSDGQYRRSRLFTM